MMQDDIADGVMGFLAGMEITNQEASVAIAIDTTLRHVVELLNESTYGYFGAAADYLELEADLG